MEKIFACEACSRPIDHRGFCFPCNIKRKRSAGALTVSRSKSACSKCGFRAHYIFVRCPECGHEKTFMEKPAAADSLSSPFLSPENPGSLSMLRSQPPESPKPMPVPIPRRPAPVFPFANVRASQQEMISDVKDAVKNGRHLVADAPTGLGKTIASLFPTLEYAAANGKTVLFLTSRLSQHKMAIETLQSMGRMNAVDIIGKRHLCSHDVAQTDSGMFSNFCYHMVKDDMCEYYKNFRTKGALTFGAMKAMSMLREKGAMHSEDAKRMLSSRFCTYEILMEVARGSNAIVGDYFHVFSPTGEKFFKRMGKSLENSIIIVDEAHNLPERIRQNLSSKISTRTTDMARKEDRTFELGIRQEINAIEDILKSLAKSKLINAHEAFVDKEEISGRVEKYFGYNTIVKLLAAEGEKVLKEKKKSAVFRIAEFFESWKSGEIGFARILSRERILGEDHIVLHNNCMDPSITAKPIIAGSHSTILMSGTLSPMEMYRDVLGMDAERTTMKSYASPFPSANRLNIIATGVTTKYSERNAENFAKIAKLVAYSVESVNGNVAVFFPSYQIMESIHELSKGAISKKVFMEKQGLTKEERKKLQNEFADYHAQGGALFGVLGGSFSEGIDLPGERLNGVVIVGIPLERPSLSSKALIEYYDQRFKRGMQYGYLYPAMIKVMQAAGRCIRTESDRGVCVFVDDRFTWSNYSKIFPRDWKFVTTEIPEAEIRSFFGR